MTPSLSPWEEQGFAALPNFSHMESKRYLHDKRQEKPLLFSQAYDITQVTVEYFMETKRNRVEIPNGRATVSRSLLHDATENSGRRNEAMKTSQNTIPSMYANWNFRSRGSASFACDACKRPCSHRNKALLFSRKHGFLMLHRSNIF